MNIIANVRFEFATANRIVFGRGAICDAGTLAAELGRRALVVTGRNPLRAGPLLELLRKHGVNDIIFPMTGEPEIQTVRDGLASAARERCDLVIAFGGGSAIDTGKAVAALLANGGELFDHLEIIGRGKPLTKPSAPFIAIPTTAGTGSEVTRNAVLASPEHRLKVSLRSPFMLPRIAIVDPELTRDLSPALTASTGLDALTQLIEPFVCRRANPITDTFCRDGITGAARSLRAAFDNGRDGRAREDMALASLFGGLALANAGLGAVHGLAGPIGGLLPAPHGAICAALLPHVMSANLAALRERQPAGEALCRYEIIARLLTGRETAVADDGVAWVRALVAHFQIPPLGRYGLTAAHNPELIEKAANASSMKANPIALTSEELMDILARAR
ncbi:MAG TPA: iron-containing alcohol dehydrogenase [Verrucomicrobiae bacterium]|nr:iron-containing alcohol dehydrogenase [Verrucomicrobiae bacterium]